jgi:hypothetical protein
VNNALALAVYERQKELNEIRQALGVPVQMSHDDLIKHLRALANQQSGASTGNG